MSNYYIFANELTIFHDDGCADIDGDNYNETVDCDDQDGSMFSDRMAIHIVMRLIYSPMRSHFDGDGLDFSDDLVRFHITI